MHDVATAATFLPAREPRWDVLEEHLDEAAFGVEQFLRTLESPELNLEQLARYPEERLVAHIDALVVAGELARTRVLAPVLEEPDPAEPGKVAAAALVLVEAGGFGALAPLLAHPEGAVRQAAATGAKWAAHPSLDRWLFDALDGSDAALRAGLLEVAASRGLAAPRLLEWLQSPDRAVVEAAARGGRFGDPSTHLPLLQHLLDHELPAVRDGALVACLAWGSSHAWKRCKALALDPAQPSPLATQLTAALGGRAEHAQLVEALGSAHRPALLFALGFSGNVALLEPLLAALQGKPPEAQLAAQALGLLFGFLPSDEAFAEPAAQPEPARSLPPAEADPEAQASLPPLEEDDLEADLVPLPEASLPLPNVQAITTFCIERAARLPADQRVLFGAAHDARQLASTVETCPLRWRHLLALGLGVRGSGSLWVDTRAFSVRQRQQQAFVRAVRLERFQEF